VTDRFIVSFAVASLGTVKVYDLCDGTGSPMVGPAADVPMHRTGIELRLRAYEREVINGALIESGGNVSAAARALKTSLGNLRQRMRRLGIRADEIRQQLSRTRAHLAGNRKLGPVSPQVHEAG
jgi:hypothetical protein